MVCVWFEKWWFVFVCVCMGFGGGGGCMLARRIQIELYI